MGLILEGSVPEGASGFEVVFPQPLAGKAQAYLAGEIPNELFPPPTIACNPASEIKRRHVTRLRFIQEIKLSKD